MSSVVLCYLSDSSTLHFSLFVSVLRERLTERELDFLNLPVSPLHHRVNWDRHSMTTDELLSVPFDGSMPVTHTTAFIQGFYTCHTQLKHVFVHFLVFFDLYDVSNRRDL